MSKAIKRIYYLRQGDNQYLVNAQNKAQAIRRIAERTITCELADQLTMLELGQKSFKVIEAVPEQVEAEGGGVLT